jgi:hypothetical protein
MGLVEHTVSRKIPHLGVAIGDLAKLVGEHEAQCRLTYVLLHAQECFPRLVLPVAHVAELLQVLLDGLLGVLAPEAGAGPLLATALELEVLVYES